MSEEQEVQKEVVVRQIKLGYSPIEDRLMFEITMTEKDKLVVWLTRKAVKTMWQVLHGHTLPAVELPELNKKPAELLEGDKVQALSENLGMLETLMPRTPLFNFELFVAFDCSLSKSDNHIAILDIICQNGKVVKVALNNELTQAIVQMLQQVTTEADWALDLTESGALISTMPVSPVLH